jgi:integrase
MFLFKGKQGGLCFYEISLSKGAELPIIRFYDIRHTFASMLIERGEKIKYIQSQLGHSNPTVTLNVYAHLMKPVNQEAACRLENAVFK